jgi:hypothetical protein
MSVIKAVTIAIMVMLTTTTMLVTDFTVTPVTPVRLIAVKTPASVTCNHWRKPVKTGSDKDRNKVHRNYQWTTMHYMTHLPYPSITELDSSYAESHRIRWWERRTWMVAAWLNRVRIADDGDFHLDLRRNGESMVAEVPNPICVPVFSPWWYQIQRTRAKMIARLSPSDAWLQVGRWVHVRGLGFTDRLHEVSGQAPNGIELHPVTGIQFK